MYRKYNNDVNEESELAWQTSEGVLSPYTVFSFQALKWFRVIFLRLPEGVLEVVDLWSSVAMWCVYRHRREQKAEEFWRS